MQFTYLQHVAIVEDACAANGLPVEKSREGIIQTLQIVAHAGSLDDDVADGEFADCGQGLAFGTAVFPLKSQARA